MDKQTSEQVISSETEHIFIKMEPEWNDTPHDMSVEQGIGISIEPEIQIKEESREVIVKVEPLEGGERPPDAAAPDWPFGYTDDCGAAEPERAREEPVLTNPLIEQAPTKPTSKRRKIIECDICHKQFPKTAHLKRHIRIHTGEKPYSCDICKRKFSHLFAFNRHSRNHTGTKPHTCEICHKQFTELHNLITHKRIHTGERPYVCDVCQKPFIKSTDLNKHKRIHTGEKPFGCNICKKHFSSSGNLTKHVRTHTGEKRHCCNKCDKQFTKRVYLEKHVLLHNEEKLDSGSFQMVFRSELLTKEADDVASGRNHALTEKTGSLRPAIKSEVDSSP